jgi:hypothetical protein
VQCKWHNCRQSEKYREERRRKAKIIHNQIVVNILIPAAGRCSKQGVLFNKLACLITQGTFCFFTRDTHPEEVMVHASLVPESGA